MGWLPHLVSANDTGAVTPRLGGEANADVTSHPPDTPNHPVSVVYTVDDGNGVVAGLEVGAEKKLDGNE